MGKQQNTSTDSYRTLAEAYRTLGNCISDIPDSKRCKYHSEFWVALFHSVVAVIVGFTVSVVLVLAALAILYY